MLVDALVFGVYKCVSSLLNVSVLLLLELDFKRVYFIQTGAYRHLMSVLRLPQEDVVAIFRYLFLLLNEELPSLQTNPCGCFGTSIKRLNVQRSSINQRLITVFYYTENAKLAKLGYFICMDFRTSCLWEADMSS